MNSMSHVWQRKTYSCWKTFLKLRKSSRKRVKKKEYDLAKETVKFLSHIDYACLRYYTVIYWLYFYLTKRRLIRKSNKSELITELKSMKWKNIPTHLPPADYHRKVIINFMAYTRKVSIKKQNLKICNDFFISFWSTFRFLFKSCNRVDIAFDVYKEQHQSKWTKTKNNRWRHRNNYLRLWLTFSCGKWSILVCI